MTFRDPSQAALQPVFPLRGGLNCYQPELAFVFSSCCFYFRPEEGLMCLKSGLIFSTTPIDISEFSFAYKPCPESASYPQSQGLKKQRHESVKLLSHKFLLQLRMNDYCWPRTEILFKYCSNTVQQSKLKIFYLIQGCQNQNIFTFTLRKRPTQYSRQTDMKTKKPPGLLAVCTSWGGGGLSKKG